MAAYLSIAKFVGIALLAAVLFIAGYKVASDSWSAKYNGREAQLLKQMSDAKDAQVKELQARDSAAEEAQSKLEESNGKLSSRITSLAKQLASRPRQLASAPDADRDHPFSVEFPRALNSLSDAATGNELPAPAAGAQDSTGAADTAPPTAALTRGDVVDWYAQVAQRYGECLNRLDAIRKWDDAIISDLLKRTP